MGSISAVRRGIYSRGIEERWNSLERCCSAAEPLPFRSSAKKLKRTANGAINVPIIGDCGGCCRRSKVLRSRQSAFPPWSHEIRPIYKTYHSVVSVRKDSNISSEYQNRIDLFQSNAGRIRFDDSAPVCGPKFDIFRLVGEADQARE